MPSCYDDFFTCPESFVSLLRERELVRLKMIQMLLESSAAYICDSGIVHLLYSLSRIEV